MFKIIFFPFFKVLIMSFYSNTFIFYAILLILVFYVFMNYTTVYFCFYITHKK